MQHSWRLISSLLYFPETGSDSELSWEHSSGHAKESVRDAEKDVKDLKGNKILSTEAKNILSDLELDTDDESGGSLLHYGTRAPCHRTGQGHPTAIFGKISVRKTI